MSEKALLGTVRYCESDPRHRTQVGILKDELYEDGINPKLVFLPIQKLMTSSRQELVGIMMTGIDSIGNGTFDTIDLIGHGIFGTMVGS